MYDPALPRVVDRLRLRLGDVDSVEWLPDETYEALIGAGDFDTALPEVARALYALISMEPVKRTHDGEAVDYSGRLPMLKAIYEAAEAGAVVTPPRFDLVGTSAVSTEAHW